jgi:hypothetical protein
MTPLTKRLIEELIKLGYKNLKQQYQDINILKECNIPLTLDDITHLSKKFKSLYFTPEKIGFRQ